MKSPGTFATATLMMTIVLTGLGGAVACGGGRGEPSAPAAPVPADESREAPRGTGDSPATGESLAPVPSHAPVVPGQGGLRWTAPSAWIETTPASPMRRAQYRIPAAPGDREDGECVVYYFGAGQGGDQRANMSRWVAQFSGPGSESPRIQEIQAGGLTVSRVEVGGTYTPSPMSMTGGDAPEPKTGYRLLGAIAPGPDANWFFKCTGPDRTMQANRERFDALVNSIRTAP